MGITRVGVVGSGWRAQFFSRLALELPEHFELVGVVARNPETAEQLREKSRVPVYATAGELVRKSSPDFVAVAVAASANATVIEQLVDLRTAVLAETPPAETTDGLRELWHRIGPGNRVQIAEQYLSLPGHHSRRELVRRGIIGRPTSVQVSSTHNYHAVSIMRGILGPHFEPVLVRAYTHSAPLLDPLCRSGWVDQPIEKMAENTIATIDFGDSMGLYDFTDNQWHNQLRHRRIVIRGSRGEIADDSVIHMPASETILRSRIERSQLGYDLNLDGYDTEHLAFQGDIVFRNPFLGHRLMDEEIAIATLMKATGEWSRDESPEPYPLAHALQDQLIGLAITQAAVSGEPVKTAVEEWGVV